MFTFYIVGVVIVILFYLSFLAWHTANEETDCSNIFSALINTLMLSVFSWMIIFVIVLEYIFDHIKKNKEGE